MDRRGRGVMGAGLARRTFAGNGGYAECPGLRQPDENAAAVLGLFLVPLADL